MRKMLTLAILFAGIVALGALKDDIPDDYGLKEDLTSQTQPGTALKNNTIYTVRGHVLINAKANAGQSALKVPAGSAAVIEIPANCSLTVIGGDAEEQVGAGAGIEVPMGAKLVICGEGKLTAIGGNAAPGEKGHRGAPGEVTPLIDLKKFPMEKIEKGDIGFGDLIGAAFGTGAIADIMDSILLVGKGGTGGAGGFGGGGAAAGIGGKGGRGGAGGPETVGQRVVPTTQWGKRQEQFEGWFETLGWGHPYVYGYSTWNVKSRARTLNGATGARGDKGASGMTSGEIIIAEEVKVAAYPGQAAAGGASGTCGKPFSTYDMNQDNTQIFDFIVTGVQIGAEIAVTIMTAGANKAAEGAAAAKKAADDDDDDDDDDEEDDDTSQKLWFYGGGGGAGGAGGAAPLQGIGPGGAGGGGGGAGGSGLFIVGSNLADEDNEELGLEANGHGGLGGEAYIPAGANAETIAQIKMTAFGQDASALNGGESAGQAGKPGDDPEDVCFNLYGNEEATNHYEKVGLAVRPRLGCWTTNYEHDHLIAPKLTDDCFAYAGLPGIGGKAGGVETNYCVFKSSDALVVSGLDMTKKKDFSGKVFCKLTLMLGGGEKSEDWYVCGTAISPCVLPSGTKIFAGYYTKPNGGGQQYFDKFGNPSGYPFIQGDLTLYAHWVDADVDLGIRACEPVAGGEYDGGKVFTTGKVYYFDDDCTFGDSEAEVKGPGARIVGKAGETVIFYIAEDVTVEFNGTDGDGRQPGYAGIEVPEGVTLVVTGTGTLEATGGDAGWADDGLKGGDGSYTKSNDHVEGGHGGRGGGGAGGAAAAIGGSGGRGGYGGWSVGGNSVYCDGGKTRKNGNTGYSGGDGADGGACGNVVIVGSLSVILEGGDGADGGQGGGVGARKDDTGSGNAQNYTGTGGGGGAGGGGSSAALTIGGGIGGGAGGGGGGSGSTINNDLEDIDGGDGYGGRGGRAAFVGYDGKNRDGAGGNPWDSQPYHRNKSDQVSGGWYGYSGGPGRTGAVGTYSRGLNLDVTAPHGLDREKVLADTDYVYGHPTLQRTITFTFRGETLGTVLAMMGEPLPTVIVDKLEGIRGFEFAGAYLVDEDGLPVLDDLGFEDWWYDEFGIGEKVYDVPGDATLEVRMEPKWEVAAEWPDEPDFVYDGTAHRVLEKVDPDAGFTVVGGTLVATNAGIYAVQLKLKDGYEVWDDADWCDFNESTNDVRTWLWVIQPAQVAATFENQAFDWNATNTFVGVTGKIPAGMQVSYSITGMKASGVYELTAEITHVEGAENWNYWPAELTSLCTIPPVIGVKGVLPFYPWNTGLALDFTLDETYAEAVLAKFTNITVCATIATEGKFDLTDTNAVRVCQTIPTSELALRYGTALFDLKEQFPDFRGKLWVWLAVDGVPASEIAEVGVDTTGTVDPNSGVMTYEIDDVKEICPINYSWRFSKQAWNMNDHVQVSIDGGRFAPLGEQGYASNEGSTAFTPTTNGEHPVGLVIGYPDETGKCPKGEYTAIFKVNDPTLAEGGSPATPGKVIRNRELGSGNPKYGSYSTLAAAIADYTYGDVFDIYGDVQGENVEIPVGATLILADPAAKIIPIRADAAHPWLDVTNLRDAAGNIYGYKVNFDAARVKPGFGADAKGDVLRGELDGDEKLYVFTVTNTYAQLYYCIDYKQMEVDPWIEGQPVRGAEGVTYITMSNEYNRLYSYSRTAYYRVRVLHPTELKKTEEK